jgi:transcriptional regulator
MAGYQYKECQWLHFNPEKKPIPMYVPKHFEETDKEKLRSFICHNGFGILVVADSDGIEANHLPFHLKTSGDTEYGILECHVARNNPVWRQLESGVEVLAIFQGPDAYISPAWYPTKVETGRAVPTWDYLAVHASGQAKVFHEPEWLLAHLHKLTNHHEAGRDDSWSIDDAPPRFIERLLGAIVGIEITVTQLTGKCKASQNQPECNREGVIKGLTEDGSDSSLAMAKLIT